MSSGAWILHHYCLQLHLQELMTNTLQAGANNVTVSYLGYSSLLTDEAFMFYSGFLYILLTKQVNTIALKTDLSGQHSISKILAANFATREARPSSEACTMQCNACPVNPAVAEGSLNKRHGSR